MNNEYLNQRIKEMTKLAENPKTTLKQIKKMQKELKTIKKVLGL